VEHVRISVPVVEGGTEGVPTGEVTKNEGQQSQQTQQRPHRGDRSTLAHNNSGCHENSLASYPGPFEKWAWVGGYL